MDKEELEKIAAELEAVKAELQSEMQKIAAEPSKVTAEQITHANTLKGKRDALQSALEMSKSLGQKAVAHSVVTPAPGSKQPEEMAGKKQPKVEMGTDHDREKPFKSFGEQLHAIAQIHTQGTRDERLGYVNKRYEEEHAASGMGEAIPSNGGFMIQRDFVADLMTSGYASSVLAPKCRKIPISQNSNGVEIPFIDETSRATGSRNGGVQIYWGNEADTATAKKPKIGLHKIDLGKLIACAYATDELLEDAPALGAIISQAFAEEFAFVLDDVILRGDGVGKPLGIINAACLVSQAAEGGQTADTVVTNNIIKMMSQMDPRSLGKCEWFINQEVTTQLPIMTLPGASAAGVPIYLPPSGLAAAPLGTLYGRPINVLEQCSAIGDVGDIILADFSKYALIDKGSLQAATSMHVRFLYSEQTFRFQYRVGGAPLVKVAKTSYKGAVTPSPFVTLAAR